MRLIHSSKHRWLAACLWAVFAAGFMPAASAAEPTATASTPLPAVRSWAVTDYGAAGDGKAMNTEAFRKTIEACAGAGGGRVFVPAGTYVTGPIELKSGVDLHLAAGATIQFSRNLDDYPLAVAEYEGRSTVQARSPIWGEKLRDVSITGAGTIDGSGEVWRPLKKSKVTPEYWESVTKAGGVVEPDGKTWWPSRAAMEGQGELQRLREGDSKSGAAARVEDYAKFKELLRPP